MHNVASKERSQVERTRQNVITPPPKPPPTPPPPKKKQAQKKREMGEKQLEKRTIGTARTTQNAVKTNAKRPKNNKNATAFYERWSNYSSAVEEAADLQEMIADSRLHLPRVLPPRELLRGSPTGAQPRSLFEQTRDGCEIQRWQEKGQYHLGYERSPGKLSVLTGRTHHLTASPRHCHARQQPTSTKPRTRRGYQSLM